MGQQGNSPERSYGCTFGCGNPYDVIVISVRGSDTLFLCMPCYVRQCVDIITAMTDPGNMPSDVTVMANELNSQTPMTAGRVRKRGKNAPAETEDDDLIAAYDDLVTSDELPGEFT